MSKHNKYDSLTYEYKRDMAETIGKPICVYGWSTYTSGTLEGQPMKSFIDCYEDAEAALAAHPTATPSHAFAQPQVNLNHLPGEDDPVPGGRYLDDLGGDNDSHYD